MLITILFAQNFWGFVCSKEKICEVSNEWDEGQWQVFELTGKKRECERIRNQELLRKKKSASSFAGFSDISSVFMLDETPAPY